jgi:hypothetical protein
MQAAEIFGISLGTGCPPIHSLLADDLILCGTAIAAEAHNIHAILQNFCTLSGQTPNLH